MKRKDKKLIKSIITGSNDGYSFKRSNDSGIRCILTPKYQNNDKKMEDLNEERIASMEREQKELSFRLRVAEVSFLVLAFLFVCECLIVGFVL